MVLTRLKHANAVREAVAPPDFSFVPWLLEESEVSCKVNPREEKASQLIFKCSFILAKVCFLTYYVLGIHCLWPRKTIPASKVTSSGERDRS